MFVLNAVIKTQPQSQMNSDLSIQKAILTLTNDGVIAYPTEAMFGLGCNIYSDKAVTKILDMKQRSYEKGLIIVGSCWDQVKDLTNSIPEKNYDPIFKSWPGHNTWVFPASINVPRKITGKHKTIAIRISNHPIVKLLCEEFRGPIVSTSANTQGKKPALTATEVKDIFKEKVDYIVQGKIGDKTKASTITSAVSLEKLRF